MYNLLPEIDRSISGKDVSRNTVWKPADAHPITGKVSTVLESQFRNKDVALREKITIGSTAPQAEPNIRLASSVYDYETDPSPLSEQERGVGDEAILSMRPVLQQRPKRSSYTPPRETLSGSLSICALNDLSTSMDIFVQKKLTLETVTINPNNRCIRTVAGEQTNSQKQNDKISHVFFHFSTLRRATVTTTNRQVIKDFVFNSIDPIGLEIELQNGRLCCSNVSSDCQASQYTTLLDGAELIAVNEQRVIDLEEFQDAMIAAKESGTVSLKMAAFKDGRGKLDTLYLHDFKNTTQVKSLLSNLFNHGGNATPHSFDDDDDWSSDVEATPAEEEEVGDIVEDVERTEEVQLADGSQSKATGSNRGNERVIIDLKNASEKDQDNLPSNRSIDSDDSDDSVSRSSKTTTSRDNPNASDGIETSPRNDHGTSNFNSDTKQNSRTINDAKSGSGEDNDYISDDICMIAPKTKKAVEAVASAEGNAAEGKNDEEEEDTNTVDTDSDASWNKFTKVDEVYTFKSIVCLPRNLLSSEDLGDANSVLQVSNYSKNWIVNVYWIDMNGTLIDKGSIPSGTVIQQPCAPWHVWAIVATAKETTQKMKSYQQPQPQMKTGHADLDESVGDGSFVSNSIQETKSPAILTIRPASPALVATKCTSVMWTPWSSLSINQRIYSQNKSSNRFDDTTNHTVERMSEAPEIHIQVFDGATTSKGAASIHSSVAYASSTAFNELDRAKLTKWPRRKAGYSKTIHHMHK